MKVLLLAMRSSHKKFFTELQKKDSNLFDIAFPRYQIAFSLKGLTCLKHIDLRPAIDFAVEEFRIKVVPLPYTVLHSYFKTLALFHYLRYYTVIDKNYNAILIWNGGKYRQLIAIEIAKLHGIQTVFFENGLLPNRLVLDKKGINVENSVPRNKAFFEAYHNPSRLPDTLIPRQAKNNKKFQTSFTLLPKKFIFVPFQVDSDTQIITHSHWIKNMRGLFDVIVTLSRITEYHFVLREHPSSSRNYPDLHKRANSIENITFANGCTVQTLIERSIAVITINSTVGLESLLFKKRVIVLGDSFYRIEGITKMADNQEILNKIVQSLDTWILQEELVENFLKYLYYDYLIPKDEHLYDNFCTFIKKVIT